MPAQTWATFVIGVLGFSSVVAGILQKTHADRRAEWWRRAVWAVDHTLSDDVDSQIVGFGVLVKLQSSRLATASDRQLFAEWGTPIVVGVGGPEEAVDNRREEE